MKYIATEHPDADPDVFDCNTLQHQNHKPKKGAL